MSYLFSQRHIGPDKKQTKTMLSSLGFSSLEDFINTIVPKNILSDFHEKTLDNSSEVETLKKLKKFGVLNKVFSSYIGQGYYKTHLPGVIKPNIL